MISQEQLLHFPESDRLFITAEVQADPNFGDRLERVLSQPDGVRAVALSMRQAVANEMDSRLYTQSKGEWPVLRKTVVQIAKAMPDIVEKELERLPLETLTAMLKEIARGGNPFNFALSGMGQIDIGAIISTVVQAGASIYGAKLQSATQKRIANIQSSAEMATLNAQIKIADAQKSVAEAQVTMQAQAQEQASPVSSTLTKNIGGGIPLWVILIPALLLVAGGTFLIARRK